MDKNLLASYFNFASAAYGTNNSAAAPYISGYGAEKVQGFTAENSSFAAQLYVSSVADGSGVPQSFRIAIRGSDEISDFAGADRAFATGSWQSQMTDAVRFVGEAILNIQEKYPNLSYDEIRTRLDVTGHSLGGGLSEIVAKFFGIRGMSIDGPGAQGPVNSIEFQELKSEIRQSLPQLADNYSLNNGDFEARRYTAVGTAGQHLEDVNVSTSNTLNQYLNNLTGTPPWVYGFDLGGISLAQIGSTVGTFANHLMKVIAEEDSIPSMTQSNIAAGLSVAGYPVSDKPFFLFDGAKAGDSVGNQSQTGTQILVYRDPATGAIMEARTPGTLVNGEFQASTIGTSIVGMVAFPQCHGHFR